MKKVFFATILAAAAGMMAFTTASGPLPIGADIPSAEVKMKDVSGKQLSLKEMKGENGLLVMFSCNTCPFVIKNQERTKAISAFASKNGFGVVIINSNEALRGDEDSYEAMQAYAKSQGYEWNYVIDEESKMADAFGANRTPECFLFDANSKLAYHGAIDDNPQDASKVQRNHLKEAISELVYNKEVSVKETRSVGCTIKRKG
jgi:glutathione peroxidase-family protein